MAEAGGFHGTQPPPALREPVDALIWPWGEPARCPLTPFIAASVIESNAGERVPVYRDLGGDVVGSAALALGDGGLYGQIEFTADPGEYRGAVPYVAELRLALHVGLAEATYKILNVCLTNNPFPDVRQPEERS